MPKRGRARQKTEEGVSEGVESGTQAKEGASLAFLEPTTTNGETATETETVFARFMASAVIVSIEVKHRMAHHVHVIAGSI